MPKKFGEFNRRLKPDKMRCQTLKKLPTKKGSGEKDSLNVHYFLIR